jgi:hypothetical protein
MPLGVSACMIDLTFDRAIPALKIESNLRIETSN